jgi:hypothetical protein
LKLTGVVPSTGAKIDYTIRSTPFGFGLVGSFHFAAYRQAGGSSAGASL